ncbi:hypothetical protein [Paenibacillus methanolicus]|uniref:Uncharacterized protein n=1 Tax=Paenibacillus methanolicus TaxID=582686 RepID=A0A5S5C4W2_9BACL|nr:hypothetical protein [Paenibacillus methanolicus]TYP74475.1 hypothetical protein BCM02_10519 [Paenibacillus methanolicus]
MFPLLGKLGAHRVKEDERMEQESVKPLSGYAELEAAVEVREAAEAEQANLAMEREFHGESKQERFLREAGYSPPFSRN